MVNGGGDGLPASQLYYTLKGQELLIYFYKRLIISKMCFNLYFMNIVFLSEHSSQ